MKTKRFLFLLPLVALASCSTLGQSISRDRALEIAEDIEAQEFVLLENSFEARINSVSASGKGEEKSTSNSSIYIAYNVLDAEKGTSELIYKVNQKVTSDGEVSKSKLELYIAKDKQESDEDHTYYMAYAMQQTDDEDPVYKSAYQLDDPSRFASIQALASGATSYSSVFNTYSKPVSIINNFSDDEEQLAEQGIKINFYSSGNKNLAFKYEYKIPKENEEQQDEDSEYTKSSVATVEYSDYRFTKLESNYTSSFGNKSSSSYSIKYKSSVKVSMPSGWDKYLED